MKRFDVLPVTSPLVEIECGGTIVRSEHISDAKINPNFPQPMICFDVVSIVQYSILKNLSIMYLGKINAHSGYLFIYSIYIN